MVSVLQQQLADVAVAKETATVSLTTALIAIVATDGSPGSGATQTVGGLVGNETYDTNGRIAQLRQTVKDLGELERTILQNIQDLRPFRIREHRQRF